MKYDKSFFDSLTPEQSEKLSKVKSDFRIAKAGDLIDVGFSINGCESWKVRNVIEKPSGEMVEAAGVSADPPCVARSSVTQFSFYCKIHRNGVLIHDPDTEIAKILNARDHPFGSELGPVGVIGPQGPAGPVGVESTDRPLHEAIEASRKEVESSRARDLAKQVQEREQRQIELNSPYHNYTQSDLPELFPDEGVHEIDCLEMASEGIADAITYLGNISSAGIPEALESLKAVYAIVKRQIRREEFKQNNLAEEQSGCDDELVPF